MDPHGPCVAGGGGAHSDVALMTVILWSSPPDTWFMLNTSWHRLRPRFSALAVDTWQRDPDTSADEARRRVYTQYARILQLFHRVNFFSTGAAKHLMAHAVKSSVTYARLWRSTFDGRLPAQAGPVEGTLSRGAESPLDQTGLFDDPLPRLLIGLDADREVPDLLPLDAFAELLERSWEVRQASMARMGETRAWVRRRAHQIWGRGQHLPCLSNGSATDLGGEHAPGGGRGQTAGARGQTRGHPSSHARCRAPPADASPVFIAPVRHLWGTKGAPAQSPCSYPAARAMPPGTNACDTTALQAPLAPFRAVAGLLESRPLYGAAQLSRGPFCPSSQFWIAHRNDLPLVLASFDLWQDALRSRKWDANVVRWESTTCSLLRHDEAVYWLTLPYLPPSSWVRHCRAVVAKTAKKETFSGMRRPPPSRPGGAGARMKPRLAAQ